MRNAITDDELKIALRIAFVAGLQACLDRIKNTELSKLTDGLSDDLLMLIFDKEWEKVETSEPLLQVLRETNETVSHAVEYLREFPGPFRTYVNPMRQDGLFVGQDTFGPYEVTDALTVTHANERKAQVYPTQLEHSLALKAASILNGMWRRRQTT
jgi:hypothetical protein